MTEGDSSSACGGLRMTEGKWEKQRRGEVEKRRRESVWSVRSGGKAFRNLDCRE